MTWGKSVLLPIPLLLSGIFVVASPASALTNYNAWSTSWKGVSVGGAHVCSIRGPDGDLLCWGSDTSGQRGDDRGADSGIDLTPNKVDDDGWTSVSAGGNHTCGIRNTKLYCWGSNSNGQLGTGTGGNQDSPVLVSSAKWRTVTAGDAHTCAIRADYILACWGSDSSGQVGNGSKPGPNRPTLVSAAHWKSISAGGAHTCGVRTDGMIACWGNDDSGQVGNGSLGPPNSPTRISNGSWKSVTTGGAHSCAIRNDNLLACWGSNASGQVGNGATSDQAKPTAISTLKDWRLASGGDAHSCASRGTGLLYCWGSNAHQQIVEGTRTSKYSTPVRMYRPSANWKSADAGGDQTCGIRGAGTLECWGGSVLATYPPVGTADPADVPGFDNLSNWRLDTPIDGGDDGSEADIIRHPTLDTYRDAKFFHASSDNQKVYFRARVDGATTSGSVYPRSELRELADLPDVAAGWSNSSGTHVMTLTQAITHLPEVKPHVVAGQIHGGSNEGDVLQIRLERSELSAIVKDGGTTIAKQVLTSNYVLGTMFTVKIQADPSGITVTYNGGSPMATVARVDGPTAKWYFKAGCYTQSNTDQGDAPEAYGEVLIDSVAVTHS